MNKIAIKFNDKSKTLPAGIACTDELNKQLSVNPDETLNLVTPDKTVIPLSSKDHIIIREGVVLTSTKLDSTKNKISAFDETVKISINNGATEAEVKTKISGADLCQKLKTPCLYAELTDSLDILIEEDQTIVIKNTDTFITTPALEEGAVNLEQCSKNECRPPRGQSAYLIKIDGTKKMVSKQQITGKEILDLVDKQPSDWSLNQKRGSGRRIAVEKDQSVDLCEPGIERFETVRRQAQQGSVTLTPEDYQFLDAHYAGHWINVTDQSKHGIIICDFCIPKGYVPPTAKLMLKIPANYPSSQINMFYFSPSLKRADGARINRVKIESHFGENWQRWSRHYSWDPNHDTLCSHIGFVKNRLRSELGT